MPPENDVPHTLSTDENINEELIAELEQKIQDLRRRKNLLAGFIQIKSKEKWKYGIFVIPLLVLGLLPPLFVVLDRWFNVNQWVHYPKENWCKIEFLCSSRLPSYFGLIFFILGLTTILMIAFAPKFFGKIDSIFQFPDKTFISNSIHKRQYGYRNILVIIGSVGLAVEIFLSILLKRIPGMELFLIIFLILAIIVLSEKEISLVVLTTYVKNCLQKLPVNGTIIFSLIAIIIFMKETTSLNPQKNYLMFLPLIVAMVALVWQRKKIHKIFWLILLAVAVYSLGLSSWKFAYVGDEYSFYFYPTQFISQQTFSEINQYFFNVKGVYEVHPYFSSLITYVSMLFSGNDYFGWHIINILFVSLSIPMFYDLFKTFLHERVAYIAVIPLVIFHYLVNFSKVGYNNLQSLFVIGLIFWAANKAVQKRTFTSYLFLGLSLGACFYTFALGIYFVPLVGLFLLMFDPLRSKAVWGRYLLALLGFALIMIPIFLQPVYWQNMAGNTTFFKDNHSFATSAEANESVKFILHNLLYTPLAYLYSPCESHFVVSSLVDPLMAVFVPLGFLLSIINVRSHRFFTFLTISVLIEIIVMSITNPYDAPPMTRMFVFIPFYVVYIALGLDWVVRILAGFSYQPRRYYYWMITCVMVAAGILNIVQSTIILDKRTERYPIQSIILRLFQHDALASPDEDKSYLFLTDNNFAFYFFETFVDVYGVPDSKAQLENLILESTEIPDNWLQQIKENEDLVIIVPYSVKPELFEAWQPILSQSGKSVCEVKDQLGSYKYYQFWYSQKYPNLCVEAQ